MGQWYIYFKYSGPAIDCINAYIAKIKGYTCAMYDFDMKNNIGSSLFLSFLASW